MGTRILNSTNLLFGNVDNNGELQDVSFDKELQDSLALLPKLGEKFVNVPEALGIPGESLIPPPQPMIALPGMTQDFDTKDPNAIDFSNIQEMVNDPDEEPQKTQQLDLVTLQPTRIVSNLDEEDEDVDIVEVGEEGEEEDAEEDIDELKDLLPDSLYALFKDPKSIESKEIPEVKFICSSLNNPGGPILKFSELFASHHPERGFVPRKKAKVQSITPSELEEMAEGEEEELFYRFQETEDRGIDQVVSFSSPTSESEMMAAPLKEDASPLHFEVSDEAFDPAEQYPWENSIVWEPETETLNEPSHRVDAMETDDKETIKSQYTYAEYAPGRRLWGEIDPFVVPKKVPTAPAPSLQPSHLSSMDLQMPDIPGVASLDQPPPVVSQDGRSRPTSSELTAGHPTPQFNIHNDEVDKGDWLKAIIWDDSNSQRVPTDLILDLNDPQIFPEDPFKHPPQLPKENLLQSRERERKRKADQLDDALDPFNLSNDEYYRSLKGKLNQEVSKTKVLHSEPALKLSLVKPHLSSEDLENFHRPRRKIWPSTPFKVTLLSRKDSESSQAEVMRHKSDLTPREGKIVLAEYIEQFPLMVMNVGMGTKVKNYYRKKNPSENPLLRLEDGENVLLDPADDSPFMGDIESGRTIQALDNNLFRAPIFRHEVEDTDFLLVVNRETKKAYIREVPTIYTVGQIQPRMEVYAPNSRNANNFIKNRLQAYIYRLFMKKSNNQRLRISDIMRLFPGSSETSIRKRLKDCAEFQRGGDDCGWWTVVQSQLPNEDELRAMVTPEHVTLFESMKVGEFRLRQSGIKHFSAVSPSFTSAVQQIEDEGDLISKKAASKLDEELQLTPWNLSSNFVNAMQGRGLLQLSGLGDPSGKRGEGFSYVRMPQKGTQRNRNKEKDNLPKTAVTGTDADLRKLSLEGAKAFLLEHGVPEEKILKLSRWKRIDLVRQISNAAVATGEGADLSKFARGSRYSLTQQYRQYKEQIQMIWENQVRALSETSPEFSDSDEDDEDFLEDFEKDLESMLDGDKRKRRMHLPSKEDEEDAEDRAEYQKLMQEYERDDKEVSSEKVKLPFGKYQTVKSLDTEGNTKRVLKRTVTRKNPDGTTTTEEEMVTDPTLIQAYLRRDREMKSRTMSRAKVHLSPEEEEEKNKVRREKRRLQEQLRRLRRNKEKQDENRERLMSGNLPEVGEGANKYRCGACGLVGHMRTNRNCPLYVDSATLNGDSKAPRAREKGRSGDKATARNKREMDDDMDEEKLLRRQKRRRRTGSSGAHVALSNVLDRIIDQVRTSQHAHAFLKPVPPNNKYAPGYHDIIKKPMAISTIKENNRNLKYSNRHEFLEDWRLMVNNCYQYNKERNPHLLPQADSVYRSVQDAVLEVDSELEELERAVNPEEGDTPSISTPSQFLTPLSTPSQVNTPGMNNSHTDVEEEVDVVS